MNDVFTTQIIEPLRGNLRQIVDWVGRTAIRIAYALFGAMLS